MADETSTDLKEIWKDQKDQPPQMSTEELEAGTRRFERLLARRNLREYVVAAILVVVFAALVVFVADPLARIGAALNIAAIAFIVYWLRSRGAPETLPERMGTVPCLDFYRAELTRQSRLLRNVCFWYLLPVLPGTLLLLFRSMIEGDLHHVFFPAIGAGILLVSFVAIDLVNRRVAGRLDAQARELAAIRDPA